MPQNTTLTATLDLDTLLVDCIAKANEPRQAKAKRVAGERKQGARLRFYAWFIACAQELGYTDQEVIGHPMVLTWTEIYHPSITGKRRTPHQSVESNLRTDAIATPCMLPTGMRVESYATRKEAGKSGYAVVVNDQATTDYTPDGTALDAFKVGLVRARRDLTDAQRDAIRTKVAQLRAEHESTLANAEASDD